MPLETGPFINDLTPTNPLSSDPAGQGDDHLRLIKATLQGTFPNMGSVFGRVVRQDVALSISAIWNTNHFIVSASATATVVLTLPPAASITSGYYVDITTIGTGTVSLLPSGAASINGGVSLSIPALNTARAYFIGGLAWQADIVPHGNGGYNLSGNVTVGGTLSVSGVFTTTLGAIIKGGLTVSGATVLSGGLSVSGATVLTGALTVSGAASISGSCFVNGALTVAGTTTLSGTVVLSSGQLQFPATQNASSNANTLDDYEEGTWTPSASFATVGNLAVAYNTRVGTYTKIGNVCNVGLRIITSAFTHTTAAGEIRITGLPFAGKNIASGIWVICLGFATTLVTGGTQVNGLVASALSYITLGATAFVAPGTSSTLDTGSWLSGSNKDIAMSGDYQTD